ncbi:TATA element modulatory factor isoform X2 [Orussus abietinus]|uniref:TATA element modulatory factor isoform X2 n=1 Tax=Orussus abietinus TaxID=222816 RepID=UPI000626890D|nr:TATA element modulatory factor isoform X2 [Orussus abietinus]
MSWFDASGFASLAKSALKEAQKTIDKALDIKEEEQRIGQSPSSDNLDFFATWGLKTEGGQEETPSSHKHQQSIWGSFTGSFFENPKSGDEETQRSIKHSASLQESFTDASKGLQEISSSSLPESPIRQNVDESLSKEDSKLSSESVASRESFDSPLGSLRKDVISETSSGDYDRPNDASDELSGSDSIKEAKSISIDKDEEHFNSMEKDDSLSKVMDIDGENNRQTNQEDSSSSGDKKSVNVTRRELGISHSVNRVSIVSSGSDKKSSDSLEILGSHSSTDTDCTTTPESDANSVSITASTSVTGPKVTSESVEILPDSSVTSPSSVEVLGDWKSEGSPFLSPVEQYRSEPSPVGSDRGESVTPYAEEQESSTLEFFGGLAVHSCSSVSPFESPGKDANASHLFPGTDSSAEESSISILTPEDPTKRLPTEEKSSKTSPESIEVIPDAVDESDEVSLAEDSYTSASECTVITVMETFHHMEQAKTKIEHVDRSPRTYDTCPENVQSPHIPAMGSSSENPLSASLDSLKEKHGMHLPLEPITTQPIRKVEHLEAAAKPPEIDPFERLKSSTIEPDDSFQESEQPVKPDPPECSDQYPMLTDSSCEGTLIESSSEENAGLLCSVEPSLVETTLTTSSYVKTMLADAMVEKGEAVDLERHADVPRENSPISSESRSDLVKIGSDHTSGHTSGDELETTTSSDIEIISSPNGDSSSTQSRQSPAKLHLQKGGDLLTKTLNKTRGHSRELSEISLESDDTNLEIEKLLKRIQEMTEILEARESKLIDVSRANMELLEQNNMLKRQMDNFEKSAEQSQDLSQITDEYTQRLSALERKFQQAIRERDTLRKNLEQLRQETASRLSSQMSIMNAEKDEIIRELREEGEKLSKQQLQHSNIIKKLRLKEKENDATIKNQKEQIEEQASELERLKRSLHAKEEVERSQIVAVHTLTAKTKKQEKEILSLQERLDNAQHKMEAYKRSLDAAKVELADTKQNLTIAEEELKEAIENAGESCQLAAQVEALKSKLRQAEESHVKREESLKQENTELMKRLETAEARCEELSESVSTSTKPLLRQLEQLQANLSHKSNSFMKQEKAMSERIIELQTKLENLVEVDRFLKEENLNLKSKMSAFEARINSKENEKVRLEGLYEQMKQEYEKLAEEKKMHRQIIESLEQTHASKIKELKREINSLENKLSIEKAATDAEKRKNHAMLEQHQSLDEELRLSPTLSIGRDSVGSTNSVWPTFNDSMFESSSGRFPNVYESIRSGSNSTSMFESLQAQLKQRDGEVQQMQWELSRRNIERDALNSELSTLTQKVEDLSSKVSEAETLKESLNEIQTRYDALLQMYGEKVEENQELRLDLEDVKDMYKTQIDQLLKRDT